MYTAYEPKVQNRFIMYIDGIPAYLIKKASSPGFDDGEVVLDHINVYRKIRGKRRWDDITLEMFDPITPSGTQAVIEWARLAHESVTGRSGYSDFYKKDVKMEVLGPVGDIVGEFILKGAFIKNAKFGDYDWSSPEAVMISMVLAIDYAVINY